MTQSLLTENWNEYLESFADYDKDIYYKEEYVKLYAGAGKRALCYVYKEENHILLMPIIKNAIDDSSFDFETPYGYGGPIANNKDPAWLSAALTDMNFFLAGQKIVAGLIRFHPLLKNMYFCEQFINTFFDRFTVSIDLTESLDKIWAEQISSKNRNMIRKAEKSGFTYSADYDFENIDKFIELYGLTMQKVSADLFYFFSDKYYSDFIQQLKGNGFLGIVKKDGQIVCAALFMYHVIYGHYHLSGSDYEFSGFGANNLLLWGAVKTLKAKGIRQFHLGGGTNSDTENTLYKFKKTFSSNYENFFIGKIIFDKEKYDLICSKWAIDNPEKVEAYKNYLLKYRY